MHLPSDEETILGWTRGSHDAPAAPTSDADATRWGDGAAPRPPAIAPLDPASTLVPGDDARTRLDAPPPPWTPLAPPAADASVLGGRYALLAELGQGAMGTVLRARDLRTGLEVALKLIPDELTSPERRARFLREGSLTAALSHPGLVRVHDLGELDGRPFVAYELIEGGLTLDQVLSTLPPLERVRCVRDVARALGHAHARGVVHRDVKPQNVLVDAGRRVKVADFGLALAVDSERLTRTGTQLGTPAYMAPEQIDAQRDAHGPWTDVWALGVMLYEALCGRRPFQAPSFASLCVQIATAAPTPPRALDPTIPRGLEAVALWALRAEPALRPRDGEAFARAIEQALLAPATGANVVDTPLPAAKPIEVGAAPTAPPVAPGPRRRPAWLVPLAGAALLAGAVTAWQASPAPAPDPALASREAELAQAARDAAERARQAEARLRALEERTPAPASAPAPGPQPVVEPQPAEGDDPRGARAAAAKARRAREEAMDLPRWVSRQAAARAWGADALPWAFEVSHARAEARTRRVPVVVVQLAPDETALPDLLRDRAVAARLRAEAALLLAQHRDKRFHDEVVDERGLDHGRWPGNNAQACPIARSAPCEVHDRVAQDLDRRLPPLQPTERWRVTVAGSDGEGGETVTSATALLARLDAHLGAGVLALDDVLAAYDALRDVDAATTSGAPADLGPAADALAPYLEGQRAGGLFRGWAERARAELVVRARDLVAQATGAERPRVLDALRRALGRHPDLLARVTSP